MKKDNDTFQEHQNSLNGDSTQRANQKKLNNVEENVQQIKSSLIIAGGDRNLSPDAEKPLT
jgi:hypothetical protein